ncbi:MAG: complex I NDUFA9 subunit family protein [Alphaproteobacteria bacterium]
MQLRRVTLFGGSGFIGRHLVKRLAERGATLRVAVRDPERALFLTPMGDVGQIVPVRADVTVEEETRAALEGADAAVNLVGILYERGRQRFAEVHHRGAERVAQAATSLGVGRLVHVSAVGADARSESDYARTKGEGEAAVRSQFPGATVVRPSVVFGPEDDFFNRFAALARVLPALPVFGCVPRLVVRGGVPTLDLWGSGGPKFQPVYVGDVAESIVRILEQPATAGRTYELGGPRVYSLKEIMALVLAETRRRRPLVPLPIFVADIQAMVLGLLPRPPLTRDQVKLLRRDNVVASGTLGLADLGIEPAAVEAILPTYMDRFRVHGRWSGSESL